MKKQTKKQIKEIKPQTLVVCPSGQILVNGTCVNDPLPPDPTHPKA